MHSKTLTNWRAKRAGSRITVYGDETVDGLTRTTKIVGVDAIVPGSAADHCCYAVERFGDVEVRHTLLLN